ncbi:MAG TPA: SgcJ/EcaC family oxidoreductase [Vicinamibacterales bacterium]|nr:SgcJ/EcaC family oxidoreductase [Vicinamibacterales bacterium]
MTAEDQRTNVSVISRSRLEMLVDGVFAIAMTILVLELKVPEVAERRSVAELTRALAKQAPTFLSYLLSFLVLGMFWYRHNRQFRHYRAITLPILGLHFIQLAAAASFPFCAALVGRYAPNPLALVVYLGCVVAYAWSATATWIVARRSGSSSSDLPEETYLRERKRGIVSSVVVSALLVVNLARAFGAPAGPDAAKLSADDKAIRDLSARWQQALLARDADGQAAMFADDGVSYHDGQEPLVGPAAIRAWESRSKASHPKAIITSTTDAIQIAESGDLAVQTGEGRLTNLGENGEDRKIHRQRFVTVWKKVDGRWKVAHDIAVNVTPWE